MSNKFATLTPFTTLDDTSNWLVRKKGIGSSLPLALVCMAAGTCVAALPTIRIGSGPPSVEINTNIVQLVFEPRSRPEAFAILVNTTNEWPTFGPANMPDARWIPFQPEQTLVLDPQVKRHTVSIGFKAPNSEQGSWQELGITITNLLPNIVITNPVNRTTSMKEFQIQGFADVALKSIRFNFEKPDGTKENGQGFVREQKMQIRRPLAAKTNYFQCFDIKLQPGTNRFAVTCSDLYGNAITTNFSVLLKTNP